MKNILLPSAKAQSERDTHAHTHKKEQVTTEIRNSVSDAKAGLFNRLEKTSEIT